MKTIEERLAALEGKVFGEQPEREEPERDPYLVPGVSCEVWNKDGIKQLRYFVGYGPDGDLRFKISTEQDITIRAWSHYRVLGTVWDHAPDWAEWVAIRPHGANVLFETEPERDTSGWYTHDSCIECGYSDPTDWEYSLRRRPKWARE